MSLPLDLTAPPMNWYETNIEEEIRPVVKLLRDNGYNTIASCGHDMFCQCEFYYDVPPLRIFDLLRKAGYQRFDIRLRIEYDATTHTILSDFVIWFPKKDGTYSQKRDGIYEKESSH